MRCPVCDGAKFRHNDGDASDTCLGCGYERQYWAYETPRGLIESWIGDILRAREARQAKQQKDHHA